MKKFKILKRKNIKLSLLFGMLLLIVLLLSGCSTKEAPKTGNELETQIINKACPEKFDPQGFSGAKWGMTLEEVKSVVGAGSNTDDGGYLQLCDVYGRKATVNYIFKDRLLNIVTIIFLESYDKTQSDMEIRKNLYAETQKSLAYEYGIFISWQTDLDEIFNNRAHLETTTIEHSLLKRDSFIVEQILLY